MEVRKKGKGRSQNQRLKLFYLLDYLLEHTDETHTVKAQEIICLSLRITAMIP